MSETRSQQEPSMEEILASIRRIISEDGQEPQSESKSEPPERSEPRLAQPAQSEQKPTHEEAERPRLRAVGSGESEILVLTEMVAEDGSVVSLAAQSPAATDLSTTPESAGLPEPPDSPPGELPGELPEELPGDLPEDSPVGSFGEPDATERKMPPALDERAPAQPESDQPELGPSELEQAPPAETAEQPKVETAKPQAETMPAFEADDRMESEKMSNEARKKLELVSQEAEAASTAALAELARTVSRDKETPIDGGRSVEDLVREAVKPMLRQWLDANLPDLVERVVRTEIQRMVRRAEDKA
ncbi:DUF2497 domain-containing protein [Rhodospirillaceae bacterium SYSU D60014]|uniref:DUF2497 domain-containing protein n=1 Tax=Virgifigura deserti TaxID=2268457 RepID=UPI000E668F55